MYGSQRVFCQTCTAVYVPFQVLHFQRVVGETPIIKKHSIFSYLNIFSLLKAPHITFLSAHKPEKYIHKKSIKSRSGQVPF